MKTIYKQVIPIDNDSHTITVSGPVLHVGYQEASPDHLVFWHEDGVGPGRQNRIFQVFGTGWKIPHYAVYCGTVQVGLFVWHLYELMES